MWHFPVVSSMLQRSARASRSGQAFTVAIQMNPDSIGPSHVHRTRSTQSARYPIGSDRQLSSSDARASSLAECLRLLSCHWCRSVLHTCNARLSSYFKSHPELTVDSTSDSRVKLIRARLSQDQMRLQQTSIDASGLLLMRPNHFQPYVDIVKDKVRHWCATAGEEAACGTAGSAAGGIFTKPACPSRLSSRRTPESSLVLDDGHRCTPSSSTYPE